MNCSVQPGAAWATRTARITARTAQGRARPLLESDDAARWLVDGDPAAHLDGCLEAACVWLDTVPGLSGTSAADVALI